MIEKIYCNHVDDAKAGAKKVADLYGITTYVWKKRDRYYMTNKASMPGHTLVETFTGPKDPLPVHGAITQEAATP